MSDDAKKASVAPSGLSDAVLEAAAVAGIGVIATHVDGAVAKNIFASAEASRFLGYSVDELLAGDPLMIIAPEDLERSRARLQRRREGDSAPIRYELNYRRKDGARVPAEVSISWVLLDGRRTVVSFIVDIAARRQADEALRRSEASFRNVIEACPDAISIAAGDRFLYVNAEHARILGYESGAELMARPFTSIFHPDDAASMQERGRAMLERGERYPPLVSRAYARDGSVLLLEMASIVVEYEGAPAILRVGRDVTERRRMEAQLVQADRLAALGTLAAGVAHEVNNPLSYLQLNLEWVARQLPEVAKDAARIPELVAMIEEAKQGAGRVAAIVRELRSFSRADGETRGPVDLRQTVTTAIRIAAHELKHRARVLTELEPVQPVWANEARLEQVLLNLLINAAQAMPDVPGRDNEIRVNVRADGSAHALIEITDNGEGMSQETVRRIFDPFFTTKPVGVGTGLGLSICHSIVTSLGGRITVQSQPGEGTTFRILLPVHTGGFEEESPTSETPSGETRTVRRARVLVIDDEITIGKTLRDLLMGEHDVTAVAGGREALERVRAGEEFDVILCDLMMPIVSGMELYDRFCEERPGIEQRVVFMTGGAFTAKAADFLARVPNRRIEKPFALSAVEQLVRDVLAEGRAARRRKRERVSSSRER